MDLCKYFCYFLLRFYNFFRLLGACTLYNFYRSSTTDWNYSFGLHCVYSHCVEDSVAIQKINSKHYDMKDVTTETTYEHRFVDDTITPSYQKRRYFLTEKKMKTILGI